MDSKNSYSYELLPEELMLKIFVLLPVLSLLRCKSVCKSWLSIISNPQFIQTHLIESQKRQPFSLIKVSEHDHFYIDTDQETSSLLQLPQHFMGMTSFISCCNGLVCLANHECDVIYFWNPMTRRFKELHTPKKIFDFHWFSLGFGFDNVSNDYKILRIGLKYFFELDDNCDFVCSINAEMYSANEDSWKEIEVPKPLEYFKFYQGPDIGVFRPQTTRILYFEGLYELLSFDLHDEVFRVYPYPIPVRDPRYSLDKPRMSNLLNFEGSVAMVFLEFIGDAGLVLSLWTLTLDGDCGNASWNKQFNLENHLKDDHVALYLGDGHFVVAENYECPSDRIYYYYKKKLAKKFVPAPPNTKLYSLVKYTESLVSLKGFKQLE